MKLKNKVKEIKQLEKLRKGEFVTEEAAAEIIGLSVSTLRLNRFKKIGIPYYKMGRSVRYSIKDIHEFIKAHKVETNY